MALDYLENKPGLKPIEVLYSVIAVTVMVWAIVYVQMQWSVPEPQTVVSKQTFSQALLNAPTAVEGKSVILNRINTVNTNPLTAEEKSMLINQIDGAKMQEYHFTVAERQEIFRALNGG